MGVTVELNGMLPQDKIVCDVIFSAAHECLTNTVKHAGGDKMRVVLQDEESRYIAEFTNSGVVPKGEIKETGGLKNLRSSVEKAGGVMHIESLPQFLLRIELLNGDDDK